MMDDYMQTDPIQRQKWILERIKDINSALAQVHYEPPEIKLPEIEPIPLAEYLEKTEEFQKRCLEMLRSINTNTANLYTLVNLISTSNEKQDELLELIFEILTIAKAKDKSEADSRYKKIISKINNSVETADTVMKLISWASVVYDMIKGMLSK